MSKASASSAVGSSANRRWSSEYRYVLAASARRSKRSRCLLLHDHLSAWLGKRCAFVRMSRLGRFRKRRAKRASRLSALRRALRATPRCPRTRWRAWGRRPRIRGSRRCRETPCMRRTCPKPVYPRRRRGDRRGTRQRRCGILCTRPDRCTPCRRRLCDRLQQGSSPRRPAVRSGCRWPRG